MGTAKHPKSDQGFRRRRRASPTSPSPPISALEAARAEALHKDMPETRRRQTARQGIEDYVGTYGVREISIRDGALYYQRIGAHGGVLKAIGRDQFDLNGDIIVTFHRATDGTVESMLIRWKDGRTETVARAR